MSGCKLKRADSKNYVFETKEGLIFNYQIKDRVWH